MFLGLYELLKDRFFEGLFSYNFKYCIVCNFDVLYNFSDLENGEDFYRLGKVKNYSKDF